MKSVQELNSVLSFMGRIAITNNLSKTCLKRVGYLLSFLLFLNLTVTGYASAFTPIQQTGKTIGVTHAGAQLPSFPVYIHVFVLYIDFEDTIDPIGGYNGDPYFIIEVDGISQTTGQSSNVDDSNILLGVEIPVANKQTYEIKIQCRDDDRLP